MRPNAVYATLLTKSAYVPGALVLEYTLRSVGSRYPLVVMVTPTVPDEAREVLRKKGIKVVDIHRLQPQEGVHKLGGHDARFAETWTKLKYASSPISEGNLLMDR